MNDEILELLTEQHIESMEVAHEQKRLLELLTAEYRVSNVRTAMLDETLKKVLISMNDFGDTSRKLLDEFSH